jgi:hypothetical protein
MINTNLVAFGWRKKMEKWLFHIFSLPCFVCSFYLSLNFSRPFSLCDFLFAGTIVEPNTEDCQSSATVVLARERQSKVPLIIKVC